MDDTKKISKYQQTKQSLSAHEPEPLKPEEKKMTAEVKKADQVTEDLMPAIISPEGDVEKFKKNFIDYIEAQRVVNEFLEVCKYDGPKITDIKLAILYANSACGERNGTKAYANQIAFILKEDPTILPEFQARSEAIQKTIETNSINAQKMRAVEDYDAADKLVEENAVLMREADTIMGIESYTNIIHPIDTTHTTPDKESVYASIKKDAKIISEEFVPIEEAVEVKQEKTKEQLDAEIIESYFFEKGLKNVIIHGQEKSGVYSETDSWRTAGESYNAFISKFDFDNDSALQIMDCVGVKYAKGAACRWVDPKEKLQHDDAGKPFYMLGDEKLYLEPGTLIIDVGNTYGVSIVDKDIIQMDHHGEKNLGETSATKLLVDTFKKMSRFNEVPEWLDRYADFVTKIDNLSYPIDPDTWQEKWPNTLYAAQPFLFAKHRGMLMQLFHNHPDISVDGFSKEELEYVIGYKELTGLDDNHQGIAGRKIVMEIPKDMDPDYIYEPVTLADVVKQQQSATKNSIQYIETKEAEMIQVGLKTDSPMLGRVLFEEKENGKRNRNQGNSFGATTTYGMGFDTLMIHDRKKNSIFISTQLLARPFYEKLKEVFTNPVLVRDHMIIIRDEDLADVDPDTVRELLIDAAQIDGFNLDYLRKEVNDSMELIDQMHQERLNNIKINS